MRQNQAFKSVKLDSNESIFFNRELSFIKAKTYDVLYAELKARKLIPVDFESNAGATTIRYQSFNQFGLAKIVANYADDSPRSDIQGQEVIVPVKELSSSFGYNIKEIRAARMAGKPLEQRRANAAKRAILQLENQIAFTGNAANGLGGLLNNASTPSYTVPNDGTGTSQLWTTKTADQILRDMNGLVNGVFSVTKGVEMPTTLLLPPAQYALVSSTARSANSDTTILEYFLKNNPFVKECDWLNELTGAGASGKDRMFCYTRNPDKVTMDIPADFEQLPPQERNLEFVIPCLSSFGGTILYYPLSAAYGDGI